MTDLTDTDFATIEQRLALSRMMSVIPQSPRLTGRDKELHDMQEAASQRRAAAARVEQERQRRERERDEQRRREEWERNAPAREAAQRELAELRSDLGALEGQVKQLRERERELVRVARR